jgi:hypothetical protein
MEIVAIVICTLPFGMVLGALCYRHGVEQAFGRVGSVSETKCSSCGGSGQAWIQSADGKGGRWVTCQACGGNGKG